MTIHSPTVAALLADLAAHGINLEPLDGSLRYRPRSAMSPDLLKRLQEQKAELLAWMDLAELRRSIDRLWKDQTWIAAWERRLRSAECANLDALRRVLALVLEVAEDYHEQRNWQAFDSTRNYLHRLASGEEWDKAALTAADLPIRRGVVELSRQSLASASRRGLARKDIASWPAFRPIQTDFA